LIFVTCFLIIHIIRYPQQSFEAAKTGINTWFYIVFPALLPFFIGSELLIGLGVIEFIGTLLEPIIRPIFKVPGEGSFIFVMSITSGYPVGVKLTTQLRSQNRLTKIEGQRLLSFCSTSGPLFMIGAVAVGMFHNPQLGFVLSIAHYLSALTTGMIFRFYGFDQKISLRQNFSTKYMGKALHKMFQTFKNSTNFSNLLSASVKHSVETLLFLGGFIILFSVIIEILSSIGLIDFIASSISMPFSFLGIHPDAFRAMVSGALEITIGCKILSETPSISFVQQAVLSSMIISWSGFSIHAQAAGFISKTDLSIGIYIFSKLLHSILSAIWALLVIPFSYIVFENSKTVFFHMLTSQPFLPAWTEKIIFSSQLFCIITITFIAIALISQIILFCFAWIGKCKNKIFH